MNKAQRQKQIIRIQKKNARARANAPYSTALKTPSQIRRVSSALTKLQTQPEINAAKQAYSQEQSRGAQANSLIDSYYQDLQNKRGQSVEGTQGTSSSLQDAVRNIGAQSKADLQAMQDKAVSQAQREAVSRGQAFEGDAAAMVQGAYNEAANRQQAQQDTQQKEAAARGAAYVTGAQGRSDIGQTSGTQTRAKSVQANQAQLQKIAGQITAARASVGPARVKNVQDLIKGERDYGLAAQGLGIKAQQSKADISLGKATLRSKNRISKQDFNLRLGQLQNDIATADTTRAKNRAQTKLDRLKAKYQRQHGGQLPPTTPSKTGKGKQGKNDYYNERFNKYRDQGYDLAAAKKQARQDAKARK